MIPEKNLMYRNHKTNKPVMILLNCKHCCKEFTAERNSAKYCSDSCKTMASRNKKAKEQQVKEGLLKQKEAEEKALLERQEKEARRERYRISRELKAAQEKELADKQAALVKELHDKEQARLAEIREREMLAEKERIEKIENEKLEEKKRENERKAKAEQRRARENEYKFNLQIVKGLVVGAGICLFLETVSKKNSDKNP